MLYAVGAAIETFRNLDPTPEEVNEVKNECNEKVVISVAHRGVVVEFPGSLLHEKWYFDSFLSA